MPLSLARQTGPPPSARPTDGGTAQPAGRGLANLRKSDLGYFSLATVIKDNFVPASQLCAGKYAADCTAAGITP